MSFIQAPVRLRLLAASFAVATGVSAGCGVDERPASWAYISTVIMQPSCATVSCHSRAAAVAGLDFSDPDRGYTSLTKLKVWIVDPDGTPEEGCKNIKGTIVCQRGFRPMVTPFDPEQSRLVNMLRARNAARMPPDRPLPEASIELVERWIRAGALYGDEPALDAGAAERPPITVTVTITDGQVPDDADDGDAGTGADKGQD
jgi:hypothetical protein